MGISGGPDSVTMLDCLARQAARTVPAPRLVVAHVNYRLRAGADRDEAWVRTLAARYHYPCVVWHPAPPPRGVNLQAWAREQRYAFFVRVARRRRLPCVAVAHTADDQAETVLWHLLRGAGLRGVGGMSTIRDVHPGIRLVRPLLHWSRAHVTQYLRSRHLRSRHDPTNRSPRFTRNRIRAELLPRCEALVPGATAHLAAFATRAQEDEALLAALADRAIRALHLRQQADSVSWSREYYGHLPKPIRVRILRQIVERLIPNGSLQADHLNTMESLIIRGTGAYGLPGPLTFCTTKDRCRITKGPLRRLLRRDTKRRV